MNDSSHNNTRWITDTSQEDFERNVFERSQDVPVVVDFWAAWCAPCRMLAPVLQQLAEEYPGRFVLVKANTEEVPEAALKFGVQAIPAVYAVHQGEVVDSFQGVLPAEQLRQWIDRLLRATDLKNAEQLEQREPAQAEQFYRQVLQESPNESAAMVGLLRALFAQSRPDDCRALLAQMEERGFLEPEAERVKASLDLQSKAVADLAGQRAKAQQNPDDLQAQLDLAEALAGGQHYQEALDIALELVRKDRQGVGEKARQLMVEIFHVLTSDSELVSEYRRKLSTALY